MKKFWIVPAVLLLTAALVIVGMVAFRSPKTSAEMLAAAGNNMREISSMRFEMNLNMELSVLQEAVSLHVSTDGEMTADPAVVHGMVKTEMNGTEPTETEVYLKTENGETVLYTDTAPDGSDNWMVQREKTNPQAVPGMAGLLELVSVFDETEPEILSENELAFAGEIPAGKVELALQTTGLLVQLQHAELLDMSALNEVTEHAEAIPVRIRLDTENLHISGYELDMTDIMRTILTASVQKGLDGVGLDFSAQDVLEVTSVTAGLHFSAFDEVEEIVIPE